MTPSHHPAVRHHHTPQPSRCREDFTGEEPRSLTRPRDYAAADTVMPHPVYGALGWISVINPGERTTDTAVQLLRSAHDAARARCARRHATRRSQENDR
ncbi:DUF6194 family protein [Streptomyces mirabilis]|uniref:DUF6194 family protein n=1 Tax=Streptomyces mirabilis TaxID=68239 RepID=UPI00369B3869